jgi:hypothetical protein
MNLMAAHDACGFPSKIVENSPKPVEPIQIESDRGQASRASRALQLKGAICY